MSSDQKHALYFVPNYDQSNPDGGTHGSPLSYLRLGSTLTETDILTTARERGDDLLEKALAVGAPFFEDDGRDTQTAAGTTYFRYDGNPKATSKTTVDRAALTEELLSRGGWRDHTDGNRIVTVRGDRIDVVMGNYKRVVFGRVTGPDPYIAGAWWEVSGGHIFDGDSGPVAVLQSIEWIKDEKDGQEYWQVTERTDKGDTITRYSGMVEEHYNGPLVKTVIGVDGGSAQQNPVIQTTRYLWNETVDTEAECIESETIAGIVTERAAASEAMISETTVAVKTSTTGSGTPVASFNQALCTSDEVKTELFGGKLSIETGAMLTDGAGEARVLNIWGAKMSISIGATIEFYLGTKTSLSICPLVVEYSFGLVDLELMLGINTEVKLMATNVVATLAEQDKLTKLDWYGSHALFSGPRTRLNGMLFKT